MIYSQESKFWESFSYSLSFQQIALFLIAAFLIALAALVGINIVQQIRETLYSGMVSGTTAVAAVFISCK